MNVSFTMFNNYHNAAKHYSNGDMAVYGRLMFIVNTYGIEGEIVEDLSPVENLFLTSIRASIDKSIRLAEAGRKGGSHSAIPSEASESAEGFQEEAENNDFLVASKQACKPFEMACNEIEEEEERNNNKKNEKETEQKGTDPISRLFGSDFIFSPTQKIVFEFISKNHLNIGRKNKHYLFQIADFLDEKKLSKDFLDYAYELLVSKYEKVNLGLFYDSFYWETTVSGFQVTKKNELKQKKIKAPKICTVCDSVLMERIPNIVECPECRKEGNPIWWELDTNLNRWVCSNEDSI